MENKLYFSFIQYCQKRKLEIKISESKYLEMREEYLDKVTWWPEVQKCCDWLYDNGKKQIISNRLRNWMNNSYRWNKDKVNLQKGDQKEKNRWKEKIEPLWTPPV